MNMRGARAEPILDNSIKINVTSAQAKTSKDRIDFSPMTEIVNGYKGYWNFESYWQSGKVYEDIPIEQTKKWWKALKEPKRRYPNSKGKKVLYALFDDHDEKMDYITSRKQVYVPEYYELVKNREMISYWKTMLNKGHNLIIYDFDGPRTIDGDVLCLELTIKLLIEKINDPQFPFGHGYIVAGCIAGIYPNQYIEKIKTAGSTNPIKWTETDHYLRGIWNTVDQLTVPVRIAGFDLDDTLIHRPKKNGIWSLWIDTIPITINKLINDKYAIIIFTNQGGMTMNKNFDIPLWKIHVTKIIKKILKITQDNFYFAIYVAKQYDLYRKPNLGLWSLMKKDLGVSLSVKSFFCGDAAGRLGDKKDFSDTDRKFALNIGIKFCTPEELFIEDYIEKTPFTLSGFNPLEFIKNYKDKFNYNFKPRQKELIIMVGFPGSGKSEFVKKYILPHNYIHVNRDICKTQCINLTKSAMKDGKSIVIDNTNLDDVTRSKYIMLAVQNQYEKIRCIYLDMNIEMAKHLNNVRHVYSDGQIPKVSNIAYNMLKKKFILPTPSEHFDKIEKIDTYFNLDKLDDPKWKKIFMRWSET